MSNYRYMRSILMFDLPTLTAKQRRDYRQFVKLIKKIGFIMFQESIYVKLSVNEANVKSSLDMIKKSSSERWDDIDDDSDRKTIL